MIEPNDPVLREAIIRVLPELGGSTIRPLAEGWHSRAMEVDGRLVLKFPKSEIAEKALRREAALLAVIRPRVSMAVPQLRIHDGPPVFSSHEMLRGEHLLSDEYLNLPENARSQLGEILGRFYAELHQLDMDMMKAAGAAPIGPWQEPRVVRSRALPMLPPELRDRAERVIAAYEQLPPDPYGNTYGFFDGHGWNMAFDHRSATLNGVYDFADSGFGPLHQEFIYSSMIFPDLTERIVSSYERLAGRQLDRRRIEILTGYHRLWELAEVADDPDHVPTMMRGVTTWFGGSPGLRG